MHISAKQQGQPTVACPRRHQNFFVFFGHFIVGEVISFSFLISKLITQNSILKIGLSNYNAKY